MYIISGGRGEGNKNRKKTTGILGREERLPRWDVPRVERLQHFTVDLSYRSLFSPSGRWSRINSSSFRISRIHRGRGEKLLEFSIFRILENFLSILARYVNENIFYLLFLPSFLSTRCQISGTKIERSQDLLSASVERELRRELRHLVVHYLASWYQIDALSRWTINSIEFGGASLINGGESLCETYRSSRGSTIFTERANNRGWKFLQTTPSTTSSIPSLLFRSASKPR